MRFFPCFCLRMLATVCFSNPHGFSLSESTAWHCAFCGFVTFWKVMFCFAGCWSRGTTTRKLGEGCQNPQDTALLPRPLGEGRLLCPGMSHPGFRQHRGRTQSTVEADALHRVTENLTVQEESWLMDGSIRSRLLRETEVPSVLLSLKNSVLECKHWILPRPFLLCRGWNSGLVAFGLICDDISNLLKNDVPEKVTLEHPEEQGGCLQQQSLPWTESQM